MDMARLLSSTPISFAYITPTMGDHSKTGAGYTAFSSYDQFAFQIVQSDSARF
jgi:hypothetical protein